MQAHSTSTLASEAAQGTRLTRIASYTPWLILVYFAAQVASRLLSSPSLEMDEAEQIVLAQSLGLGYGPKPPLYTWLQIGAFELFGENVFALSALKNLLLAAGVCAAYGAVRAITRDPLAGALAATSVFLIPQIAWEAQRDLTTTVLAVAAAFGTLFAVVRVLEHGRRRDYALLGVVIAAGLLAKYNYVLLPAAMLAAALSLPALRRAVLCPRFLITLGVFALCAGPHLLWVAGHAEIALADTAKLEIAAGSNAAEAWFSGLYGLAQSTASVILLPLALYVVAWWSRRDSRPAPQAAVTFARLLWRTLGLGLLLCAVLVLVFQITVVKDRWLLPLLCLTPVALALHVHHHLTDRARLGLIMAGALGALVAFALLAGRTVLGPEFGATNRLHFPAHALAREIESRGVEAGVLASDEAFIAGNLGLASPDVVPVAAGLPVPDAAARSHCWLLVWDTERAEALPPALARLYAQARGAPPKASAPMVVEAPLLHGADRQARLAIIAAGPECRLR